MNYKNFLSDGCLRGYFSFDLPSKNGLNSGIQFHRNFIPESAQAAIWIIKISSIYFIAIDIFAWQPRSIGRFCPSLPWTGCDGYQFRFSPQWHVKNLRARWFFEIVHHLSSWGGRHNERTQFIWEFVEMGLGFLPLASNKHQSVSFQKE
jgi:hypothetical protein